MPRRNVELNISSYNFWNLDESRLIHIESQHQSFSDQTVLFTPHKLSHYVIRLIKQGTGKITVDHIDYQIKPNSLFIGHPDQIRLFDIEKDMVFESVFVAFSKEILALMNLQEGIESIIGTISKTPIMELNEANAAFFQDQFNLLLKVKDFHSTHQVKMLASLIQLLVMTITEINSKTMVKLPVRKQNYLNLYREFLSKLNENFKKYHFSSDYAELMFIPLKRLNRVCKSVTGKTSGQIIADRLDFEAKRYLYYSSNTVKEISYELGFTDPTYFIKFFRTINGESPKVFRQRISKFT